MPGPWVLQESMELWKHSPMVASLPARLSPANQKNRKWKHLATYEKLRVAPFVVKFVLPLKSVA